MTAVSLYQDSRAQTTQKSVDPVTWGGRSEARQQQGTPVNDKGHIKLPFGPLPTAVLPCPRTIKVQLLAFIHLRRIVTVIVTDACPAFCQAALPSGPCFLQT